MCVLDKVSRFETLMLGAHADAYQMRPCVSRLRRRYIIERYFTNKTEIDKTGDINFKKSIKSSSYKAIKHVGLIYSRDTRAYLGGGAFGYAQLLSRQFFIAGPV